ncbi:efflux transporter outer membrane subunit [Roseibacillus persicicus]|uniref:efflux transporter outer membrane subunit n=1 Tax=Roseibacillus persicicus TaxID=454148 RepID=UPI00398B9D3A
MKLLLVAAPLLLASCASVSLEETATSHQLATTSSWWSEQPQPNLRSWWSSFNDSQLTRLVNLSLQQHPSIDSAIAAVRGAQAQRQVTQASLFPSLDYSVSTSSNRTWSNGNDSTTPSFSTGLSASWEADLFGKNQQELLASDAAVQAAKADFASIRASLAAETALAYLQLRAAESDLSLLQDSIKSQEETTQLAQWREQAGTADSLAADQARSALESSQASLSTLRQSTEELRNRLNLLTGQPPGSLSFAPNGEIPTPSNSFAKSIPTDTIRQRPDVRSAGYRWVQAIALTRSANADQYPSLTLSGNLGLSSLGASKIFNAQSIAGNIIAGLTGPIFDAGRIRSQIAVQNAAEEQAFASYRLTLLTALSEVEDALIAARRTQERIVTVSSASKLAKSAADLASQKYEAGVIDITQVLETQRNEITLQRDLVSTRLDNATAYVELYRALGGGW